MINVYVGRMDEELVLKYPVGSGERDICRFFPLGDTPLDVLYESGQWLTIDSTFENKKVTFLDLVDKEHNISPFEGKEISYLRKGYNEGFSK